MEHSKHDSSDEIDLSDSYEEVTAHLKGSHSFDEVNDISTKYLGGYLAQGEGRTLSHDMPKEKEELFLMITIFLLMVEVLQLVTLWREL